MKRFLCLLLAVFAVSACDRPKNIPDDKLTAIVGDLFLANAYWDIHGGYQFTLDSVDVYSPVFEQYGYTPKDFMFTIGNLSKRKSIKFSDILEAALDTLQAGGRPYIDAIARQDSVIKIAAELYKKVIYFDSLPQRYTSLKRAADAPKIKLPLHPGEYKIEFSYLVDTADQNPYVQYMHYQTDSADRKTNYAYRSYTKGLRRSENITINVTDSTMRWLSIYPAYTTFTETRNTVLSIDSLRVTYYIPQKQALDSVTDKIVFKPAFELPIPNRHDRKDPKNIIPLRLDTAGLSRLGDTVVRPRGDAR